jgi:hypothetical protein
MRIKNHYLLTSVPTKRRPTVRICMRHVCSAMDFICDPWGIMDGKCIYCSDRSAGTPTLTVSWTPLPSFYWFFMCSFSLSCCQYLGSFYTREFRACNARVFITEIWQSTHRARPGRTQTCRKRFARVWRTLFVLSNKYSPICLLVSFWRSQHRGGREGTHGVRR